MPNLQHSPCDKSETEQEEPQPVVVGASPQQVSTTDSQDFFVKKGNKIGFDQHEQSFLHLIDSTITYLVKAKDVQNVEELVGQFQLLQTSLGKERVDQFLKYIELWDKFEDKCKAWKKAVDVSKAVTNY